MMIGYVAADYGGRHGYGLETTDRRRRAASAAARWGRRARRPWKYLSRMGPPRFVGPDTLTALASSAFQQGRTQEAVRRGREAVARNPDARQGPSPARLRL